MGRGRSGFRFAVLLERDGVRRQRRDRERERDRDRGSGGAAGNREERGRDLCRLRFPRRRHSLRLPSIRDDGAAAAVACGVDSDSGRGVDRHTTPWPSLSSLAPRAVCGRSSHHVSTQNWFPNRNFFDSQAPQLADCKIGRRLADFLPIHMGAYGVMLTMWNRFAMYALRL